MTYLLLGYEGLFKPTASSRSATAAAARVFGPAPTTHREAPDRWLEEFSDSVLDNQLIDCEMIGEAVAIGDGAWLVKAIASSSRERRERNSS
jgi:hypothetical protein